MNIALWTVAASVLAFQAPDPKPARSLSWTYKTGGPIHGAAALHKGLAFAGSDDGKVHAVRLVDGGRAFVYDAKSPVRACPMVSADGVVVVGADDHWIHGFEAVGGRPLWRYETRGAVVASAAFAPGGIVVVGSKDNFVYGLDATTGAFRWKYAATGPIETAAAIGLDGTVIVGDQGGKLHGLDPETGAGRWVQNLGGLVSSGPAIDGQGRILQIAGSGRLFVLSADGAILFQWTLPGPCSGGLVLAATDRIHLGFAGDGVANRLGGFEPPEPEVALRSTWSIPSGQVRGWIGRPFALGREDAVYAVSEGGDLLAIDGKSGAIRWKEDLGEGVPSAPTLHTSGLLVVGNDKGILRAYKTTGGDWPTLGQNSQRTSRAEGTFVLPGEVIEVTRPDNASLLEPQLSPAGLAVYVNSRIYAERGGDFLHVQFKDREGHLIPPVSKFFIAPTPTQTFALGDEIPRPKNADLGQSATGPTVAPTEAADGAGTEPTDGVIFWHTKGRRAYATRPGSWTLTWKTEAGTKIPVRINICWPEDKSLYRIRVAGTPPVGLMSDPYRRAELWTRDSGGTIAIDKRVQPEGAFADTGLGRSFLILGDRVEGLSSADTIAFLFVKTVAWNDPACHLGPEDVPIGREIVPPVPHHDPLAGGPFVFRERARYCPWPGYYDRSKRQGPIIPVNVDRPETEDDDLVVVYYRLGGVMTAGQGPAVASFPGWSHAERFYGNAGRRRAATSPTKSGWPTATRLYHAHWPDPKQIKPDSQRAPSEPSEIVIANNGVPEPLPDSHFTKPTIYYQNDPAQAGFNPNDEHAFLEGGVIKALRDDLATPETSEPWVLAAYADPRDGGRSKIKLFHVIAEKGDHVFRYTGTAGQLIQPPAALAGFLLPNGRKDTPISGPTFLDRGKFIWARAAGDDGSTAVMVLRYHYAVQTGFSFPKPFAPGGVDPKVGDLVPWLDRRARLDKQARNPSKAVSDDGTPIDIVFDIAWPAFVPALRRGDTLLTNKAERQTGLPDLFRMAALKIVYQQSIAKGGPPSASLLDPTRIRSVPIVLPGELRGYPRAVSDGGLTYFPKLPPHLRRRFFYDETARTLCVRGLLLNEGGAIREKKNVDPTEAIYPLLNVLAPRDVEESLRPLSTDPGYQEALNRLAGGASGPYILKEDEAASAFTLAADGDGDGYITLVENDSKEAHEAGQPVRLYILKIEKQLAPGRLIVLKSGDPFSEEVAIRHSGSFGGHPEQYVFEWKIEKAVGASKADGVEASWMDLIPASQGRGRDDAMIKGPGIRALQDNLLVCRYRPISGGDGGWSSWTPRQLVPGWVTRVREGIQPFDQRVKDLKSHNVKTTISLLEQAGPPFRGAVPLSIEAANSFGLIEIYETVYRRALEMSIKGSPKIGDPGANQILLNAAGSLHDLYLVLAEEASADAADPTIAYASNQSPGGTGLRNLSDLHCFTNLVPSLLHEELALLRGQAPEGIGPPTDQQLAAFRAGPIYNRLAWNLTRDKGEIAYVTNYSIRPDFSDMLDIELDERTLLDTARRMYPQGHGDAWGHYLTAMKLYYQLLADPEFTWVAEPQDIDLGGRQLKVDYLDERRFAASASAKARAGLEITISTHRKDYRSDGPTPALDPDPNRAWGAGDWAARSGEGAYLDWAIGNALLPETSPKTGLEKIDRSTVPELAEIPAISLAIQAQADAIDGGLNPLGIPDGVVPFGHLNGNRLDAGETHFEQSARRAQKMIENAHNVLTFALDTKREGLSQRESVTRLNQQGLQQEYDFKSKLIKIFGTPYSSDIGPGRAFLEGYDGYDDKLFAKVSRSEVLGDPQQRTEVRTWKVKVFDDPAFGSVLPTSPREITYSVTSNAYASLIEDDPNSRRRAVGELQSSRSELLQATAGLERILAEYRALTDQTERAVAQLKLRRDLDASSFGIRSDVVVETIRLDEAIRRARSRQLHFHGAGRKAIMVADAVSEGVPGVFGGIAGMAAGVIADPGAPARAAAKFAGSVATEIASTVADLEAVGELDAQQAKELVQAKSALRLVQLDGKAEDQSRLDAIRTLIGQEPILRYQLYQQLEVVRQSAGRYSSTLAEGHRLIEERTRFRRQTAIEVRDFRYRDAAFRIFRTDALRRYRSQFELAAFYTYLAARAYDYETNFAADDPRRPTADIAARVVRARTLGIVGGGTVASEGSLAGLLKELEMNFFQVKDLMNFENAGGQHLQLSLRSGHFRIAHNPAHPDRVTGDQWREALRRHVVPRVRDIPELAQYAGGLPEGSGIVIPFSTPLSLDNSKNFFGWDAGGGDVNFNPLQYGSKIRSISVLLSGFPADSADGLRATSYVYLIPVGADVFRVPPASMEDRDSPKLRSWMVSDVQIPVPLDLRGKNGDALRLHRDSLSIRQYAPFEAAYQDARVLGEKKIAADTQLIGRSVHNTRWLLVIPARNLLAGRDQEALDRFIDGPRRGTNERSGGVADILLDIRVYSVPGN